MNSRPTADGRRRAYRRGIVAETLAAGFLIVKGYRVRARRFKTRHGELDLVAQRGMTLVFAEVKARPTIEAAAHAVTRRQRERIVNTSLAWIARNPECAAMDMRFDVILVGRSGRIAHIENAFDASP